MQTEELRAREPALYTAAPETAQVVPKSLEQVTVLAISEVLVAAMSKAYTAPPKLAGHRMAESLQTHHPDPRTALWLKVILEIFACPNNPPPAAMLAVTVLLVMVELKREMRELVEMPPPKAKSGCCAEL